MPILIIIMGVSGSGKSTISSALATQYNYQFVEADDFHPTENINSMNAGIPLTDEMREPWIQALIEHLNDQAKLDQHCVLSYSGLRHEHRNRFAQLPFNTFFLQLDGTKEEILKRINNRKGHFMPADLLNSQFDSLDAPQPHENIQLIPINLKIDKVISLASESIERWLKKI